MVNKKLSERYKDHVINTTVFLVLFVIGILGGRSIGMTHIFDRTPQADTAIEPGVINTKNQWNLLVIAVDQLSSSRSTLKGLWLLITSPESFNLTLVPIFPAGDQTSNPNNVAWQESFSVNSAQEPDEVFLEKLSEHILWDDYLMIDQNSLTTILDKYTQYNSLFEENNSTDQILTKTKSEINQNLGSQLEIWHAICSEMETKADAPSFERWLGQIESHTRASFRFNEIFTYHNLQEKTNLQYTCEFPTLTPISP